MVLTQLVFLILCPKEMVARVDHSMMVLERNVFMIPLIALMDFSMMDPAKIVLMIQQNALRITLTMDQTVNVSAVLESVLMDSSMMEVD